MAIGPEEMIERSGILMKENKEIIQGIERDIDNILSDENLLDSEGRPKGDIVVKSFRLETLNNFLKHRSLSPALKREIRRIYTEAGWKDVAFEKEDKFEIEVRFIR